MRARAILQRSVVLGLIAASSAGVVAAQNVLVSIEDLTPREHRTAAFVLAGQQTLRIDAVGAEPRRGREPRWGRDSESWHRDNEERDTWPAAAWIIDARTRDVVWDLREVETRRSRNGLRRFDGTVTLPAGVYVAHYGSYPATSINGGDFNVGDVLRGIARRRRAVRYGGPYVDDGAYRDFALTIRGDGHAAASRELEDAERVFTASVLATVRPAGPGASARYGFELERPTEIEVIGVGELNRAGAYDFGWILNADTRAQVWRMDYRRTGHAGGAHKNRVVRETLRLPAGRYVAYFVADNSHDLVEWNAVPPVDPERWGLSLRIADQAARERVRPFTYEPVPAGQTLVSLIGVGDDELVSEGFTLRRPMEVRIYAIGEGVERDMVDYAWIVDVGTRRRVWTMRYEDTEHAGGAEKNRLFDGTVRLEAGSYLVYYASDGSHSARDWNDAPPAESRYWGVSVFPSSGRLDRDAVAPFERGRRGDALAELVRIGNDARARSGFRLDQDATVRVYAIGEGDGEMYDYAWIEDAGTGRVVWEMTYRTTEHAGGARKNRVHDGLVHLRAGSYVLRYRSDGSHAYGEWNADPPDDPEGWGVAVTRTPGR